MPGITVASYGSWVSPITPELVATETLGLSQVRLDGACTYWVEARPQERGRSVIVCCDSTGKTQDLIDAPFSARSSVHGYGGGAFTIHHGVVYFTNAADQQVYVLGPGPEPERLTHQPTCRYADMLVDSTRQRLVCVCEEHTGGSGQVHNRLVSIDLGPGRRGAETILSAGTDFCSSPCLSADGRYLAWLTWDHPQMPWDGTELWLAELDPAGVATSRRRVAGGPGESVFQPQWSPAGELCFVSDRTGWWNLYAWADGQSRCLCSRESEFGVPQWELGLSTYAFADAGTIVAAANTRGVWQLVRLDPSSCGLAAIDTGCSQIGSVRCGQGHVCFIGGGPAVPAAVVRLDLATGCRESLRSASSRFPDPGYVSTPARIEFPTAGGSARAHAFYYPPRNREFRAPAGEKPPLIVRGHGGPTSAVGTSLSMDTQFWTSRGFAVAEVNYRGSSGFGRPYRDALRGQWGIADLEDCVSAARFLIAEGKADPCRLAVRGSSAGGYLALCGLTFRNDFHAGASYYGISDLETMVRDTHKFESRYLDSLIGPYPERRDLYLARSPLQAADRICRPLLLCQGLDDRVVPPDQSRRMYDALLAKGIPVAYLAFAGEPHGFRMAETVKSCLDAELCFYAAVFRFLAAKVRQPVPIANLRDEWFEVVDEQDQVRGLALRSLCHGNPDLVHRTAHVIVFSTTGRVLLQKRSAAKDIQPGKWDTAVGGHLAVGETYPAAARRELTEELGLTDVPELHLLFHSKIRNRVESENVGVFRLVHDGPFRHPPEEIDELRFWTPTELRAGLGSGQFTPSLEAELAQLADHGLLERG